MRLAFVNHSYIELPRQGGGLNSNSIGLWNYQIATRLAEDHDVTVYHQRRGRAADELVEHGGVHWQSYSVRQDERAHKMVARWDGLRRRMGLRGNPRRPRFATPGHYRRYIDAVAADIARRECEAVHISNYPQFASAVRRHNPRAKINLHMQCDWLVQLDADVLAPHLERCDLISGCSDYVVDGIRRRFPALADRCYTLYNGVDPTEFVPGDEAHDGSHVLFVGRLSPEKGLHTLLDALARIAPQHPRLRVTIVGGRVQVPYEFVVALSDDPKVRALAQFYAGDDPFAYERALHRMVESRGDGVLRGRVEFIDHIPQPELRQLYRGADVFVFPSDWDEPFGMPVIEAMASGVPVVTTQSGGIPEFVTDGVTGLVVPRADAAALAGALDRLLGDAGLRRAMGARGRQAVADGFTWDHATAALLRALLPAGTRAGRHDLDPSPT
ncbi:MAG: glycosyltransferase family 4 protein [Planctomycetes bacterium]|nr:glycosyltransferase family 4 protein [Planctomycetota bacterium]MCB9872343.1 glycosyltransferase family 4 protein [Planctomycetota bacterium]MCB9889819.1 glycosyltransferase family 4 protein [Planctomycetota bacterium]